MNKIPSNLGEAFRSLIPTLAVIAVLALALWGVDWLLKKNRRLHLSEGRFSHHLIMLSVTAVGILLALLVMPVGETTKKDLLTVFGLVLTAIITLSSTTFAGNAMAGLMLRSMNKFRPGDFLKAADHFGRVTERGLFHTEIQTEDRDLTTIPNMYLVENPITVVHESGTMVSATVSLGYDVPVDQVEKLLVGAGVETGLDEPFVRIQELGDFSVGYQLTGFLKDVKTLLGTRSRLRRCMLNALHQAGIEIVSPTVMIQRRIGKEDRLVPPTTSTTTSEPAPSSESRIFDKAERAGKLEALRQKHEARKEQLKALKQQLSDAGPEEKSRIEEQITTLTRQIESLESAWQTIEEKLNESS